MDQVLQTKAFRHYLDLRFQYVNDKINRLMESIQKNNVSPNNGTIGKLVSEIHKLRDEISSDEPKALWTQ